MKTIDELIRQAGWTGLYGSWVSATERTSITVPVTTEQIERFAALVRAQALDEAAKVCHDKANEWGFSGRPKYACEDAASTILALKSSVPPEGSVR